MAQKDDARARRLAEALRANLLRRKARARDGDDRVGDGAAAKAAAPVDRDG